MFLLQPSRRHGVGVFTTSRMAKGRLRLFRRDDWGFVRRPRGEQLVLCARFGVPDGDGFHCPKHWERMSIGWYLNHSARSNIRIVGMRAIALAGIRSGTELTVDYSKL